LEHPGSERSSIFPLLARWRSSVDEELPGLAGALGSEAERCFRLAQGIASFELANELEAIGRAFESEAEELEVAPKPELAASDVRVDDLAAAE
jgi:hypothetical protein